MTAKLELDEQCWKCYGSGNSETGDKCGHCGGTGYRPTEDGDDLLTFLRRHLKPEFFHVCEKEKE